MVVVKRFERTGGRVAVTYIRARAAAARPEQRQRVTRHPAVSERNDQSRTALYIVQVIVEVTTYAHLQCVYCYLTRYLRDKRI